MSHLFRKEVFVAQQNKWTGQVILTRPFSFLFLTFCAFLIALCIIIFLIFGSYTNKTTVEGQLLPIMGVVRVYSSDIGTITHKFVEDGNFVKAGEPLFKLSTSRFGEKGNVQAKLAAEANLKKTLALQELERLKRIHQNEQKNVHNNIHRFDELSIPDYSTLCRYRNRRRKTTPYPNCSN